MEILTRKSTPVLLLLFPEMSRKICLFSMKEKTNDKCEFNLRGIPSALYFVQAIAGENRWSEILPMYPACGRSAVKVEWRGLPAG